MLKLLFNTSLAVLLAVNAIGQNAILPAGGNIAGSGGYVSYSVGQVDFMSLSNTTNAGVQQVYEFFGPLPVQLLSITAVKQDKNVLVTWETTSESNTSHFILYKSTNGLDFNTEVGTVSAAGNSTRLSRYSLPDKTPASGTNYYRIKQVDKDAKFIYSAIVAVNFSSKLQVSVYPNPAVSFIKMQIVSGDVTGYSYELHDMNGRLVSASTINKPIYTIDVRSLKPASYTLKIYNREGTIYSFIIIKNQP